MSPLTCLILMALAVTLVGGGFWFGLRTAYRRLRGRALLATMPDGGATVRTQRRTLRPRANIRCALERRVE